MPMYNLIEYCNNYPKTLESLWQYCKEESFDNITDSKSFKFKSKFLNKIDNTGTVNVEITISFNYLRNFWRTPEML